MKTSLHFNARSLSKGILCLALALQITACDKNDGKDDPKLNDTPYALGWNNDEEDLSKIPQDLNFGIGNGTLPAKVDLGDKFPPIGDQGQYGTCVSWAVGYNLKSSLNAFDKGWTTNDLASKSRQYSPKDLFWAIPNAEKGADCNGTQFEAALDVVQQRGIASMQTVPYTNLGNCASTPEASWTQEAAGNKISNYRKIDLSINTIKQYLSEKKPIVFGAKLADNFMQWNSDDVLSSNTSFDQVGQHAYHAMILSGYDDSKGPNGAFRIINSWSPNWGDAGYIWIDYNFFVNEFCFAVFVATNGQSDIDPKDEENNDNGGYDLIPWYVEDYPANTGNPRDRSMKYNVYNIGSQSVPASKNWSFCYVYYNAYNANDYGIILYDAYTNQYGAVGENGPLNSGPGIAGNWWNNIDVPAGSGIAEEVFGDYQIQWDYTLPKLNGYYYLVGMADPYNAVAEMNENNNMYYLTNAYGGPLLIQNGIIQGFTGGSLESRGSKSVKPTAAVSLKAPAELSADNRNAYTPKEIRRFIQREKESGRLQDKVTAFVQKRQGVKK